jgi:DNA polymerase-3 subunit chi
MRGEQRLKMADSSSSKPEQDVLFYVLQTNTPEALEAFVGKLLHKIVRSERHCDVRLDDAPNSLQHWDQALWSLQAESFLPHSTEKSLPAPIQLWANHISEPNKDVLLNLHPEFPVLQSQYQRTIEVLDQSEQLIQRGRERWKQYRQNGIEPTVHKIG